MALDYHLERRIRLNPVSQYKSLYQWSLGELDDHGEQVGQDQVPSRWTQYFTAIEIVMRDELEVWWRLLGRFRYTGARSIDFGSRLEASYIL